MAGAEGLILEHPFFRLQTIPSSGKGRGGSLWAWGPESTSFGLSIEPLCSGWNPMEHPREGMTSQAPVQLSSKHPHTQMYVGQVQGNRDRWRNLPCFPALDFGPAVSWQTKSRQEKRKQERQRTKLMLLVEHDLTSSLSFFHFLQLKFLLWFWTSLGCSFYLLRQRANTGETPSGRTAQYLDKPRKVWAGATALPSGHCKKSTYGGTAPTLVSCFLYNPLGLSALSGQMLPFY